MGARLAGYAGVWGARRTQQFRLLLRAYAVFALGHLAFKIWALLFSNRKRFAALAHLPGKTRDFLFRDFAANIHRLHDWRADDMLRHKGAELIRSAAPIPEVTCMSARTVETILKSDFQRATKPAPTEDFIFGLLGEFLGDDGIFVLRHGDVLPVEHSKWYSQRKTASKLFTKKNFEHLMYDTIIQKSDVVLEVLDRSVPANQTENQKPNVVNIQALLFSFTFCAIQRIFFNKDTNESMYGKPDEFQQAFDEGHRDLLRQVFTDGPVLLLCCKLLPFPFGSLSPFSLNSVSPGFWLWRNYVTRIYPNFRKNIATLHRCTRSLIIEARESKIALHKRHDLLSYFLRSKEDISDKQLRDIILNFIIAGRDTTACTLTWFVFELTQNPQVQEKLAEEVYQVLGESGLPTLQNISAESMPYLHGCLLETLRLHPPVPENAKILLEPVTFPEGTTLPSGVKVIYSAYIMGRDPSRYPDPLEFRPERWSNRDPTLQPTGTPMFDFPVFQAGNRYCIGMQLAKSEVKIMMSRLVKRYVFSLDPEQDPGQIIYAHMLTMSLCNRLDHSSHELPVVVRYRKYNKRKANLAVQ